MDWTKKVGRKLDARQRVASKTSKCHFSDLIFDYFYVSHLLAKFYSYKLLLEEYLRLQNLKISYGSGFMRIQKSSFCAVDSFKKTLVHEFSIFACPIGMKLYVKLLDSISQGCIS